MGKDHNSNDKTGSLSKFHQHRDGSVGWDSYDSTGKKVHIYGTEISKDEPRNRSILSNILSKIFGTNKDD